MRHVPDVRPEDAIPDLLHRLRNPMAALKSGISLVMHVARPSGEARDLLDQMVGEVGRLDATTRETQRYFRLSAGRPAKVRVADAARDAAAAVRDAAAHAGVEIVVGRGGDEEVVIDHDQFLFSLTELLANACRHSPPGGTVRVSWRRTRKGPLAVDVVDSGAGVPAAHSDRIGAPYFTTSPERTGLGVATVAKICTLAGGSLRWGNLAGGGCRFSMELPIG
ncbi:MAG TPA: HAMP domain-containing sensor histidine kinase [Thermoanaerobaculaceae bacterium]|nr:HAMP domain-containing sensor histidine kinase [Thermoanaerobaculaceae bacterium]